MFVRTALICRMSSRDLCSSGPIRTNSQAYAFRIGTILLAGFLSFLGGLVFILCSQKDAKNSKLWYLRFWGGIFSRTELTHQVFLSNPFAPSPATSPGCTNGLARHQNQSEPLEV
jgi:hypothetical protein